MSEDEEIKRVIAALQRDEPPRKTVTLEEILTKRCMEDWNKNGGLHLGDVINTAGVMMRIDQINLTYDQLRTLLVQVDLIRVMPIDIYSRPAIGMVSPEPFKAHVEFYIERR